jgi:hypothetical protein
MIFVYQQATVRHASWRVCRTHPGFEAQSSLNGERAVTMEILLRRTRRPEGVSKSKQRASIGARWEV